MVRSHMRASIQKLYEGSCDIYEFQKVDTKTGVKTKEVLKYENRKCRLSFNNLKNNTEQTPSFAAVSQIVKLIIDPELEITEGSKIIITQHRKTYTYKHSGISAIYSNHQEIVLENVKEKA